MPYYTSLVGEMRNVLLSTNFFNIDQQFHQENIERIRKHTLSFFDGYSYLKVASSLINLEQLEATYRKLQRINEHWRQIMIWDNGKNSGYTCGASPFHPVAHLLDTRPCSAARCAGYFPTDEEISQEVKNWIKNNPEKNIELREELNRFYGIQNQKSVTQ